jgi:hypothetical protein
MLSAHSITDALLPGVMVSVSTHAGIVSVRLLALLGHVLCAAPLYWTRIDSITVMTQNTSQQQQDNESFLALITLTMACLVIQAICLGNNLTNISFGYCLHILFDVLGSFFALWIAFDSLSWKTYIVVVTFCVYVLFFFSFPLSHWLPISLTGLSQPPQTSSSL